MTKTQKVELVFEKNGGLQGLSDNTIRKEIEIEIPENGFETGVHLVGAKVLDRIDDNDGITQGVKPTGWVVMVSNVIYDRDIEQTVGSVLTIVDAMLTDQDQKKAFKSLVKQAIYNRYNTVVERSSQIVHERGYALYGEPMQDY